MRWWSSSSADSPWTDTVSWAAGRAGCRQADGSPGDVTRNDLGVVKEALPHGQFGAWPEAAFGRSERLPRTS